MVLVHKTQKRTSLRHRALNFTVARPVIASPALSLEDAPLDDALDTEFFNQMQDLGTIRAGCWNRLPNPKSLADARDAEFYNRINKQMRVKFAWAGKDSNLRRPSPADLQSAPVVHLGTCPKRTPNGKGL
jgi:hypothetical protein